jgi:hypoxanthine phosphoribosyltransferase
VKGRPFLLEGNVEVRVQPRFRKDKILDRVQEIGRELFHHFLDEKQTRSLTLVSILTGGLVFTADLVRALNGGPSADSTKLSLHLEFIKARGYPGAEPAEAFQLEDRLLDPRRIEGRHVVLVDDVVGTGRTLRAVYNRLRGHNPLSLTPVVLLLKRGCQKDEYGIALVPGDRYILLRDDGGEERGHLGFLVESEVIVGYGMDYLDALRDLSWIGYLQLPTPPTPHPAGRPRPPGRPRKKPRDGG